MSIFWAEGQPRPHATSDPETWACPADSRRYYIRFLADPVGVWLHWVEAAKRTIPCTGLACKLCPAIRQQWKGFAPALLFDGPSNSWRPRMVELTENARDELLGDESPTFSTWRGTTVQVWRNKGVVHAVIEERPVADAGELPPAWDIKPTLIRMWQIRTPVLPSKDAADSELPETLPFRRKTP